MDRLSQLKYNPFQKNNDIALNVNSENLDKSFNMNKISCDYYLPNEFKKQTFSNSLIIHEENTKENHKRIVS